MARELGFLATALMLLYLCSTVKCQTNGTVCYRGLGLQKHLDALHRIIGNYTPGVNRSIDLVVLMDRSKSVRNSSFFNEKAISNMIVSYLASLKWWLHRDYARMSAISYGHVATTEFDGISQNSDTVNACVSRDKIDASKLSNDNTKASSIVRALSNADSIFDRGRKNRDAPLQILWSFFDGEPVKDTMADGKNYSQWIQHLHQQGIHMFVTGIGSPPGGWMVYDRETTVMKLATSPDMYACDSQWLNYLQQATKGDGTTTSSNSTDGQVSEAVYVVAGKYTSAQACANCTAEEICVCDVVSQRIGCQTDVSKIIDYVSTLPPLTYPSTGPPPITTPEPPLGLPLWAIITIIVGATFFIVLIVVLISVACSRKRRKNREEAENNYFRPEGDYGALFAPPIIPRRVKASTPKDDPNYTTAEDYKGDSDYIRNNSFYSEPPSSPSFDGYGNNDIPEMGTITLPYEEVIEDNEFNMPGWPSHLTTLQHNEGLNHLCVYTFDNSMWSAGHASRIVSKEHKAIKELIESGDFSSRTEVPLFGNKYRLEPQESDSEYIHMRRSRQGRRGGDETVWVLTWGRLPGQYMVIGAADEVHDQECKVVVAGLQDQLRRPGEGGTPAGTLPPIPARSYNDNSGFDAPPPYV